MEAAEGFRTRLGIFCLGARLEVNLCDARPARSGNRRANRNLPVDGARREVGIIHEVHGVAPSRGWSSGFRIHHAGGPYCNNERYQRDPDLSDEMEDRGVRLRAAFLVALADALNPR